MNFTELAETIIGFVRDNREWAAPVVFLLAFGESLAFVSLILPFWIMLFTIGTLIGGAGNTSDFLLVWIAASLGAAAGDWLSYWIGFTYKREIAGVWPLSKYPNLIPRGHAFFDRFGVWAIVLGRFSGPLRAVVPLVAGILDMPWIKFQIANVTSAFLWAGVLLAPGSFGLKWWFGP